MTRIPGPRGRKLVRALPNLARRPHEFLLELALEYGPVVSLPFPREHVVVVTDPEILQYIFHQNYANYLKQTNRWRAFRLIVGNGLIAADGDDWRRQRQRIQPAFHAQRLGHFENVLADELRSLFERWRTSASAGTPIDVYPNLLRLSLQTLVRAMFGRDIQSVSEHAVGAFMRAHRFINPVSAINLISPPRFVRRLIAPGFRDFERSMTILDGIVYQIIAERQATRVDTGDLLSMLVLNRDEESGATMNARQVRDEVMTMFMAGHETTSIAVTWALYLLSMHPEVRRALQEEVRQVVGSRMPAGHDLPQLNLTRMVIDESMRLYPPAWGLDRWAAQPDVLGGYRIDAGAIVAISIYAMHHHPKYWTSPETFDPYRFAPERSAGRPNYAYFPFGGGARRCVGLKFGLLQTQLMLASIVQQFDMEVVEGPPIKARPVLNLPPERSVLMRARPATAIQEPSGVPGASNK